MRIVHLVTCMLLVVACGDNKKTEVDIDAPGVDIDAPDIDAPPDVPDGIAEVRAATDGTVSLPIVAVTVTYLKPQIGSLVDDPAGFTVQRDQTGPAIFVAVDPATITPPPVVGDVVSFTVDTKATTRMQPRVTTLSAYTRHAQNTDVSVLAQNVSAVTDLVSAVDTYDSELITITGSLGAFSGAGAGFQAAQIDTAGITGNADLQIRSPLTTLAATDMVQGCTATITNVPVGRFDAEVQITAFNVADVSLTGCAAPVVVKAIALTATTMRVTFSRNILASSLVANGSQFTFDNGLLASAATASGRNVIVTTGTQVEDATHIVTVAATVTDLQGTGVATPTTASFFGFRTRAIVRINELNANITGGCDLIELRVVTGGSMTGFTLKERLGGAGELAFVFPLFNVATNDIVVVHMNSPSTTCNPGTATQETTTVLDQPSATFGNNFDTAFDFWTTDTGLTATDNVFTLFDPLDAVTDAVFVSDDPAAANAAVPTEDAAAIVGAANQWSPALASYVDAVFRTNAADDLNATGTARTGNSIQRPDNTDENDKADWTTGAGAAQTFGLINVGQLPF